MGSQYYKETTTTEKWTNSTGNLTVKEETYWFREARPPDWSQIVYELEWAWDVHVYGSGSLFCVLSILCLLTVLRLNSQLTERPHLSSLNIFLGILATSRFIVLFADPYGSRKALPVVMLQVLWDLGYPCLVSAFGLLQLSFVRTTQVKMSQMSDESTATVIITFHFCLIITSGVLAALQHSLRIVWLFVQVLFIAWGSFLCLSSLLGCLRLLRSIVQADRRCEIKNLTPVNMFAEPGAEVQLMPRIRITDVNEQTHSFTASTVSLHLDQQRTPPPPQRSETYPMNSIPHSPTRFNPPDSKTKAEDAAVMKPLISVTLSPDEETNKNILISSSNIHSPISRCVEELKIRPCRSRIEKQLRRLMCTSSFGVALCLLKAYEVFGPHAFLYSVAALPWFFFQTISRIVEFTMAFAMVSISQQSMNNNHYFYPKN